MFELILHKSTGANRENEEDGKQIVHGKTEQVPRKKETKKGKRVINRG